MTQKALPRRAFHFAAAVALDGERKFSGVAYSGEPIRDHAYWANVIFDLSTTTAAPKMSALFHHDPQMIVGATDAVDIANDVRVQGHLYDDADGQRITSKPGHPWQMSVYIKPGRIDELKAGDRATVNGREFVGPGHIFRDNVIREVSFCSVGADPNTSASVFAASGDVTVEIHSTGANSMPTVEELQATVAERDATIASLNTRIAALEGDARNVRASAVASLFADIGRTFANDDERNKAVKPYLDMSAETFSAVSTDLRAQAKTRAPGSHLFTEQARGDASEGGNGGAKSPLLADAEKRAGAK